MFSFAFSVRYSSAKAEPRSNEKAIGEEVGKERRQTGLSAACKKSRVQQPGATYVVDFAIGLVIFVLNLSDGEVLLFVVNSSYRRIVINPANQKGFWG